MSKKNKSDSRKLKRYLSLIKQSFVYFVLYTCLVITVSLAIVQEFTFSVSAARSAASRGIMNLAEASSLPISLGTFFNYYLNESLKTYVPVMILLAAGIILLLFRKERNTVTVTGLSALPFTKKERFTINFLMGFVSLSFGFIFYFLNVLTNYKVNKFWMTERNSFSTSFELFEKYDSLSTVLVTCALAYLSICICYLILLIVMSLMGKLVISMGIGYLFIYTPLSIITILEYFTKNDELINYLKCFLSPSSLFEHFQITTAVTNMDKDAILSMTLIPIFKLAFGIVVAFLLCLFVYKIYQDNEVYRVNLLFMYPVLEKHFIPITSVSLGLCGAFIANTFLNNEPVFILTIALLGVIIGFTASSKLLALDRK